MTLRRRLALLYVTSTAVLFLAAALAAGISYRRGLIAQADKRLMSAADEVSELLEGGDRLRLDLLRPKLEAFSDAAGGLYLDIYDAAKNTLYSSDPGLARPPQTAARGAPPRRRVQFSTYSVPGGAELRTAALFLPAVSGGIWLELSLPIRSPLNALPGFTVFNIVLFSLSLLSLMGWAGWVIAGRALAPIERIAAVAETVSGGALSERITSLPGEGELGRLVDVLNGMLAAIEAYSIKMRQFASNVSHQLRTPITIMRGETEVLLLGKPGEGEMKKVLESNLAELETMTVVIEDILSYSRMDGDKAAPPRPEDLSIFMSRIAKKAAVLAGPKSQKIETDTRQVYALIQPGKLEQALLNIIDNAVKNIPEGGTITLRAGEAGGKAVITVEDNGPGVRNEDLPRLFERGYSSSGSGLGLGLARALVESFSGKIEVSSAPGRGLTVRILLPPAPAAKT